MKAPAIEEEEDDVLTIDEPKEIQINRNIWVREMGGNHKRNATIAREEEKDILAWEKKYLPSSIQKGEI